MEDNRADVFLIREAIEMANGNIEFEVLTDGEKAIRYFEEGEQGSGRAAPALVILDINLPKRQGGEVLKSIRVGRQSAKLPVLVVTSSGSERDREEMRKLGISGYFRKPSDYADFLKLGEVVKDLLAPQSTDPRM